MDIMWKQLVITCIEFVIGIGDFDLLFKECRDFFKANTHLDLFYSQLEYFIMLNKDDENFNPFIKIKST